MVKNDWEETLNDLKEEITSMKSVAEIFSVKFEKIRRQAESFKVAFLNRRLEEQRRSVARSRGYTSIMKDGKKFGASLGAAAIGSIVAGIISRDKFVAVNAGLSGFDATLRGLGETPWAVSLGKELAVLPKDKITTGKTWVTWESLKNALEQLEREASQGAALGGLDDIISRLRTRGHLIYLGSLQTKSVWVKVR